MSAVAVGPALRPLPGRPAMVLSAARRTEAARGAAPDWHLPLGLGVSGLWHSGALALAVVAGVFQPGSGGAPVSVAEVALISVAAFDAMVSAAPRVDPSPPPAPPPAAAETGSDIPVAADQAAPRALAMAAPDAPRPEASMSQASQQPAVPPVPGEAAVAPTAEAEPDGIKTAQMAKEAAKDRSPKTEHKAKPKVTPAPDAPSGREIPPAKAGGAGGKVAGGAGERTLMADWGGRLRAKVDRARRYPAGADGATGKVTLRLTVASSGQVLAVRVTASSGQAALDRAALEAVKRAGRLPKAPAGLDRKSYSFNLPVLFTR
jgi:periplasmic protein TonB